MTVPGGENSSHATHPGGPIFYACFTRRGDTPLEDVQAAFSPHNQWVADQEAAGRIMVAGPLMTDDMRYDGDGLIVFRVNDLEEARRLAAQDPMHARGVRSYEVVPWRLNEGSFQLALSFSNGGFEFH